MLNHVEGRCRQLVVPAAQAGAPGLSLTAVSVGEAVVPASGLASARAEIAELQRVLGKKTLENEILKEAVQYAAEESGLRARP